MSTLTQRRAWELLRVARVARFATPGSDLHPQVVPICFAVARGTIYHAIDHKPKRTRRLARLIALESYPVATVLADHYEDEDWSRLWWVKAAGGLRVIHDVEEPEAARALDLLAERYVQYREFRPIGPVVALDVERITGWSAAD